MSAATPTLLATAALVVGVAGSGKTTALAAVAAAFESEGFEVLGTSTSGQAARTLATAAGIGSSRTLASVSWLPRRERRVKEGELAQWRARLLAAGRTVDDLRTPPEADRIDGAESEATARLAGLHERQHQRADWFVGHPEAAHRLDRIDREVQALDIVVEGPARGPDLGRGPMRDRPWLRGFRSRTVRSTSASGAEVARYDARSGP